MSHILFNVIPFKLASDASVLTPQKRIYPSGRMHASVVRVYT